jgi:hypothetical protein
MMMAEVLVGKIDEVTALIAARDDIPDDDKRSILESLHRAHIRVVERIVNEEQP